MVLSRPIRKWLRVRPLSSTDVTSGKEADSRIECSAIGGGRISTGQGIDTWANRLENRLHRDCGFLSSAGHN